MAQVGLDDCSAETRAQIERCLAVARACLSDALVGVYLHGSLALGCFNPLTSDLDLLVVVDRPLTAAERRRLTEQFLHLSLAPHPIEISLVRLDTLRAWRPPAPFEFHYSEGWRERAEAALRAEAFTLWSDPAQTDEDLAAHLTVTRRRGRCLTGRPIAEVFPSVPATDYAAALLADLAWAKPQRAQFPVYAVLNACRTCAFWRDGEVLSKAEGGAWALGALPAEFQPLIRAALEAYAGPGASERLTPAEVASFCDHVEALIHFHEPDNAQLRAPA